MVWLAVVNHQMSVKNGNATMLLLLGIDFEKLT